MKDDIIRLIGIIFVVVLIGLGFGLLERYEKNKDIKTFNEGACTECDGRYEFRSASGTTGSSKRYYYTCDKCGHTIEVKEIMK